MNWPLVLQNDHKISQKWICKVLSNYPPYLIAVPFDKPGDLQRMASNCISHTDQQEAYLVGKMAVRALLTGENDKMVTLVRHTGPDYYYTTGLVDLASVANVQQLMPAEFLDESKTMVTQAFYDYALPLIGAPLPRHATLKMTRICI